MMMTMVMLMVVVMVIMMLVVLMMMTLLLVLLLRLFEVLKKILILSLETLKLRRKLLSLGFNLRTKLLQSDQRIVLKSCDRFLMLSLFKCEFVAFFGP